MCYFLAAISALAMGGVYLFDATMRRGVYNRWSQPLIISCVLNPIFACPIFLFVEWHQPPVACAMMAMLSGVLLAVANAIYFLVFFSEAGEASELAACDSSAPIGITLITGMMVLFGVTMRESLSWWQWGGILLASGSLALVHLGSPLAKFADWKHRIMLIGFLFFNAIHMMVIDAAQKDAMEMFAEDFSDNVQLVGTVSTYPFYWLGLLAGVFPVLLKKERGEFLARLTIFRAKLGVILTVEILATAAFAAQLGGFAGGHVAVIAVITGSFPLVVFLGGMILVAMKKADETMFPPAPDPWRRAALLVMLIIGIAIATL